MIQEQQLKRRSEKEEESEIRYAELELGMVNSLKSVQRAPDSTLSSSS